MVDGEPSGGRLLIVEDNDVFRDLLARYLRSRGYDVAEAADGAEGIEMLSSYRPDLILCDLRMPRVDGLRVLEVVKQELPGVPVIVMSGAGLLDDAVGALKLGAADYLMKPIQEMAVLDHSVRRTLHSVALARENERYRASLEHANETLAASLRRLEQDEEAGRQIQLRLLPKKHQLFCDYEFSRDLTSSSHLSGDFVDSFAIDDAHVGFYLADVAGHGVSSAFITVFLKSFMQRQTNEFVDVGNQTILSPARTLARLNGDMLKEGLGKHLTIFYGVLDAGTGRLTYSSAGQFPCPILFDGKTRRLLPSRGLPVGLFGFARFDEQEISLPHDFVLALCSDGVLEILEASDLEEKTARLGEMVCNLTITVEGLHEMLGVDDHRPLPDDVTLLMVKRGGEHGAGR